MFLSKLPLAAKSLYFSAPKIAPMPVLVNKPQSNFHPTPRFFATDNEIKNRFFKSQVSRISFPEPRADELITAIRNRDYGKAELLVKAGVNVDGHNKRENTALTDAAKRGDTKGVEFLIKVLKANISASCDCPDHKTGLHYAAENGHYETLQMLLQQGANPNVLDSRKRTALDVAKTPEIKAALTAYGSNFGKAIASDEASFRLYFPK